MYQDPGTVFQSRKLVAKKAGPNLGKGLLRKVGGPKPIAGPPTFKSGWAIAHLAPPIPTPMADRSLLLELHRTVHIAAERWCL